jgi:trigger factor
MRVEREDLNPCTVLLKVSCSPEQVQSGVRKAIKALSKRIKVPGFRPGTAPVSVMEQMLSPQDIDSFAQEETINASYKSALQSEGLTPVEQGQIMDVQFDRGAEKCEYSVKVPLAPKVELGEYRGLKAEKFKVDVTEDEVMRQIDELRARTGKKKAVDRGVREGDNALVNIKVEGAEGDGKNFMVVAGQTFPDLDAALLGMKTDDIKSVGLTFPDAFAEADMAGKTLKCTLTVRSVSAVELPEVDDEFAKSMQLESLEEMKGRIRENILLAKQQMAQEMVNERLLEALLSSSTVHVADTQWEGVAERRLAEIRDELAQQGATLAQYAEQNGMSEEQFVNAQREEAKTQVQRAVLLREVFNKEGLKVTERDSNEQFLRIAYENRVREDELKKFAKEYGPQIRDEIVYRTIYAKVMGLLNEAAEVTEVEPPRG